MRAVLITTVLLVSAATIAPALALQGSDTMSAWGRSTEQERSDLLKRLFGDAKTFGLRRCLDETAAAPGHADLAIADVAKVCASSNKAGQPV